ncbi:hypothetical protein [Actinomycetospora sp.]|uniref:hypothetical protein n=1 Tax=Actinomycetospora sp. TaxID=1872135 RepID=UPI002F4160CC
MSAVLAGPVGWVTILVVLGILVTAAFVREARPVTLPRTRSRGSVFTFCAGAVALVILALHFYGFS